jgi:hypothetical protein
MWWSSKCMARVKHSNPGFSRSTLCQFQGVGMIREPYNPNQLGLRQSLKEGAKVPVV